ncbi:MAG: hypothetical protein ACRCX2_18450 [Paraclostridium sp.]
MIEEDVVRKFGNLDLNAFKLSDLNKKEIFMTTNEALEQIRIIRNGHIVSQVMLSKLVLANEIDAVSINGQFLFIRNSPEFYNRALQIKVYSNDSINRYRQNNQRFIRTSQIINMREASDLMGINYDKMRLYAKLGVINVKKNNSGDYLIDRDMLDEYKEAIIRYKKKK